MNTHTAVRYCSGPGCGIGLAPSAPIHRLVIPKGPTRSLEPAYYCDECWDDLSPEEKRGALEPPILRAKELYKGGKTRMTKKPTSRDPVSDAAPLKTETLPDSPHVDPAMKTAVAKFPSLKPGAAVGVFLKPRGKPGPKPGFRRDTQKPTLGTQKKTSRHSVSDPAPPKDKTVKTSEDSRPIDRFDAVKIRAALSDYQNRQSLGLSLGDICVKHEVFRATFKTWIRRYKTPGAVPDSPLMGSTTMQSFKKVLRLGTGIIEVDLRVNLFNLSPSERSVVFGLIDFLREKEALLDANNGTQSPGAGCP